MKCSRGCLSLLNNALFTPSNDSKATWFHSPETTNAIKLSKEAGTEHVTAYSSSTLNHPSRASQPQDELHVSLWYSFRNLQSRMAMEERLSNLKAVPLTNTVHVCFA